MTRGKTLLCAGGSEAIIEPILPLSTVPHTGFQASRPILPSTETSRLSGPCPPQRSHSQWTREKGTRSTPSLLPNPRKPQYPAFPARSYVPHHSPSTQTEWLPAFSTWVRSSAVTNLNNQGKTTRKETVTRGLRLFEHREERRGERRQLSILGLS